MAERVTITKAQLAEVLEHERARPAFCLVCGEKPPVAHGRCDRCRQHYRRTGRERPKVEQRHENLGRTCMVCEERPAICRGRCGRCDQQWRRTGK